MAAPVFVSKGTASVVTTNAPAPSYPASVVANDLLVMVGYKDTGSANQGQVVVPAGWTYAYSVTFRDSTGNFLRGKLSVMYRVATGALSGTVLFANTGNTGNTTVSAGQIYRITGADTATPFLPFANTQGGVAQQAALFHDAFAGAAATALTWPLLGVDDPTNSLVLDFGAVSANVAIGTPTGDTALASDQAVTGLGFGAILTRYTTPAASMASRSSATTAVNWPTVSLTVKSAAYTVPSSGGTTDSYDIAGAGYYPMEKLKNFWMPKKRKLWYPPKPVLQLV